jgi:hypothetical protein
MRAVFNSYECSILFDLKEPCFNGLVFSAAELSGLIGLHGRGRYGWGWSWSWSWSISEFLYLLFLELMLSSELFIGLIEFF